MDVCLQEYLIFSWTELFIEILCGLQLVRKLQAQDGNVVGEEEPATPKKIFQLLNEVNLYQQFFIAVKMCHDWCLYMFPAYIVFHPVEFTHHGQFPCQKRAQISFFFFFLLSYQPIASLLVTCSMLYANVPFFDLIHLLDAYSMLSFLSDNWGSFVSSLTWAGIKVVLAMCSGIPWLNLVFQKIDLEMIKGKKIFTFKVQKNKK